MTDNAKKTRTSHTAAERAQAALDAKNRKVKKLTDLRDALKKQQAEVQTDLERAQAQQKYAAANPDLPRQTVTEPLSGGQITTGSTS